MNSTKIIDGKAIANKIYQKISVKTKHLQKKYNITPGLAVVLVGDDLASSIYVKRKEKETKEAGMNSYKFILPSNISKDELINKIKELNADKNVNGILVQLPLPKHLLERDVINTISPFKDVDGFHVENVGKVATGQLYGINAGLIPCTPLGCLVLIKSALGKDLSGLKALVVGSSNIVGKPMSRLLLEEKCTITVANSRTHDLKAECLQNDIIVVATGVPGLIKPDMIKQGATIIDVGINRITLSDGGTKIVGDVDFEGCLEKAAFITPVPGGVGPMTIACLLKNTLIATCRQYSLIDEIGEMENLAYAVS